ncbi:serpin family protein [Saccharomonospora glauca]|uniref:Serine protease inhibitor n=1 Tax=Saccharomonospora glauca K62 TaxID=928724 RepID=I1D0F2_9PSEU|nr:serpin family protein [Saccharomonospora glauca]EIE98426.1 serine protease inhibitor [Saccharomonospora glauca K62]
MPVSDVATTHLEFTLALHKALTAPGVNACFSPYSVASALALVTRAAREETAAEPAALLASSVDRVDGVVEWLGEAAALDAPHSGEDTPSLAVSTTLWVWNELPIKSGFTDALAAWPAGAVREAPFVKDPEGARTEINADVARTTHDLIPELLPRGTIVEDTVASLVSALYLKAGWVSAFRRSDTAEDDFHTPSGTVRVPMMRGTKRLGYAAVDGWQLVDLPAVGGVTASVLLPDRPLEEAEPELDAAAVTALLDARREAMVRLRLPRLTVDVRCALREALGTLGVRRMFDADADFGELTDDPRLTVTDVIHQSVLRLDEDGLEGAAATAALFGIVSAPAGEPVTVTVDRPFLLLVRHRATGALYFLARVVRP